MPTYYGSWDNNRRLQYRVTYTQNIANNTSTLSCQLWMQSNNGTARYSDVMRVQMRAGGTLIYNNTGNRSYGSGTYQIASASHTVTHNAEGKATVALSGLTDDRPDWGGLTVSGSLTLPTIPRATTPEVTPPSGSTGDTFTIAHDPASSSFYHDVAYSIDGGTTYTDIQTDIIGTDISTDWTPPHSLLPSSTNVTAIIRLITKSGAGGSTIGTKTVSLPLLVPTSVKPTVSAVTWEEAQVSSPDLPTMLGGAGRCLRRWSKLKPTVTSSGAGGSTVTSATVTLAGQTTDSGVAFSDPANSSGAVPFTATAIDSRGRSSDTYFNTVQVKAYDFPNLPTPVVTRTADAGGATPDPTGTYLRITPAASVSVLDFGDGDKNLLEWQIRTRPKGGAWTTVQAWTGDTVSGNTWTTPKVIGGYAASTEYDVEVSIRDLFGKDGYNTANTVKTSSVRVPTEEVFMDWNQGVGVGLGQYHSGSGHRLQVKGGLFVVGDSQVDGDVFSGGSAAGKRLVRLEEAQDASTLFTSGTVPEARLPVATVIERGMAQTATQVEVDAGTDISKYVTPETLKGARRIDSGFVTGMTSSYQTNHITAVTFDTSVNFTEIPTVILMPGSTPSRLRDTMFRPLNRTTTGFDLSIYSYTNSTYTDQSAQWIAIQP